MKTLEMQVQFNQLLGNYLYYTPLPPLVILEFYENTCYSINCYLVFIGDPKSLLFLLPNSLSPPSPTVSLSYWPRTNVSGLVEPVNRKQCKHNLLYTDAVDIGAKIFARGISLLIDMHMVTTTVPNAWIPSNLVNIYRFNSDTLG